MFDLTGTLKLKKDETKVSDAFKKREFVVTDNSSNYPQHVLFQLTQDRCRALDDINVGDEVKVKFFIRGREWQSKEGQIKYFTSLDAWSVETVKKGEVKAETIDDLPNNEGDDGLPF